MTISMREADTSTTTVRPNFSPASSLTHTPSPSSGHGRPIADVAHRDWMSGGDAEARRSEVIDRVHRLSWFPLEPVVRITVGAWTGADSSAFPLKTVDFTVLAGDGYPDLCDVLRDLKGARDEALEEGFPVPSDTALRNARRLLCDMYWILPRRFEVYPMPDGEIAIDVPGGRGRSVILLCEPDGGALCLVNIDGKHRRARYADTHDLPDGFVCEALKDLERREASGA